MNELEYYKKIAKELEEEKTFADQMQGCLPLLGILMGIILIILLSY